jgi:hypothetical protein
MTLQGKGYFVWRISACENGDVIAITNLAKQANYTHLLIKVADGVYSYNIESNGVDLAPPLVQALHAWNIQAWGWHYLYGDYPGIEADKAIERIKTLRLDGYALDVESEYKQPGKEEAARIFMNRLRYALPTFPVALCSYRFPSYHPQVPWAIFLENCDYNMPQVYWEQAHNPGEQLARCVREFMAMTPYRSILPVGSAYPRGSWTPTPDDILEFLQTTQSLNLSAASFWEWGNTRRNLPDDWEIICDFPWSTAPTPLDITQEYINALNTHNPDVLTNLYLPSAIHVNAARTIQGTTAIHTWYQTLLSQLLPNAAFVHTGFNGSGSARHLTWTATSSAGNVYNGSDTFGLYTGKIAYHYTFFTIAS